MDTSGLEFAKPGAKRKRKNHVRRNTNRDKRKMEVALFDLMRPLIFERDGNMCVFCGGTTQLAMAHVLPQGTYKRLRFEPYNIMTMDFSCHLGGDGWHKNPLAWRPRFDEKYPGRYERLQIAARCAPKVDLAMLLVLWQAPNARELAGLARCGEPQGS